MNDSLWKIITPLKLFAYLIFYYLSVEFYIFIGSIVLLFILYFITEYWVSGLLNQYRDLMDDVTKAKFDLMTQDEKLKALDCRNYDSDFIYIRDTLRLIYNKLV